MAHTPEEQNAIDIAKVHNVGDLGLGMKPNQTRENGVIQAPSNIGPQTLVHRTRPADNWQFTWCPMTGDDDFYYDCKADGYKPVLESEWILLADLGEWDTPESSRKRWNEVKHLVRRNELLLYRPKEKFDAQRSQREGFNEESIEQNAGQWQETTARNLFDKGLPVETSATIHGVERTAPAPKRRPQVDMGG